jgi:hypothetical protein
MHNFLCEYNFSKQRAIGIELRLSVTLPFLHEYKSVSIIVY